MNAAILSLELTEKRNGAMSMGADRCGRPEAWNLNDAAAPDARPHMSPVRA
jgi:hypothetical protein